MDREDPCQAVFRRTAVPRESSSATAAAVVIAAADPQRPGWTTASGGTGCRANEGSTDCGPGRPPCGPPRSRGSRILAATWMRHIWDIRRMCMCRRPAATLAPASVASPWAVLTFSRCCPCATTAWRGPRTSLALGPPRLGSQARCTPCSSCAHPLPWDHRGPPGRPGRRRGGLPEDRTPLPLVSRRGDQPCAGSTLTTVAAPRRSAAVSATAPSSVLTTAPFSDTMNLGLT